MSCSSEDREHSYLKAKIARRIRQAILCGRWWTDLEPFYMKFF